MISERLSGSRGNFFRREPFVITTASSLAACKVEPFTSISLVYSIQNHDDLNGFGLSQPGIISGNFVSSLQQHVQARFFL